jgi:triacylglycerol lipase
VINVVLAPGILGFDRFGPVQYFNGVAEDLRRRFPGAHVLPASTRPLGSVEARAHFLAAQIRTALAAGVLHDALPIHLLAHSLGGLDARFVIARMPELGRRIASLVCIGTPHLGSPVATLLEHADPLALLGRLPMARRVVEHLRAHAGALRDLSEPVARAFDAACPDDPRVRYCEVAGTGRSPGPPTAAFFAPTFALLSARAGANDGMVPLASATRGRVPLAQWPGDHAELIGHDLDRPVAAGPRGFSHLDAYAALVRAVAGEPVAPHDPAPDDARNPPGDTRKPMEATDDT